MQEINKTWGAEAGIKERNKTCICKDNHILPNIYREITSLSLKKLAVSFSNHDAK